jgi:hypothetical protein
MISAMSLSVRQHANIDKIALVENTRLTTRVIDSGVRAPLFFLVLEGT